VTTLTTRLLASLLLVFSVFVQAAEPAEPEDIPLFTQAELDQMLAPVALYPDELLSQLLMAATYPLEVVEAARFSRANPELKGQDAVRAVESKPWDPSVKAMLAFPQILDRMDQDLEWTRRLGDAFLAQQEQVMDTVQALRERADEAGNLKETEHVQVVREERTIIVRNRYPDVVYVPYYDPVLIYGSWWWPDYQPVRWSPWRGYRYYSGYSGFFWGPSIVVGHGFFYSHYDWRDRYVRIVEVPPFYYRRPPPPRYRWEHDYHHRKGVPYRHKRVYDRYHDENDPVPRRPPRDRYDDDGQGRRGDAQPPADGQGPRTPPADGKPPRTPPADGVPRDGRPERERPDSAGTTAPVMGTDSRVPGARPEVDAEGRGDRGGRSRTQDAGVGSEPTVNTSTRTEAPAPSSPRQQTPRYSPPPQDTPRQREAPEYSAPQRETPSYSAPKRETPTYSAPKREVPEYSAPKRETPDYSAPQRETPSYSAPKRETPEYSAPRRETPSYSTPKREVPEYSAPKRETPSYSAPKRETPEYSAPQRETPSYSTPKRETPEYSAPRRETPSYSAPQRETPSYSAPKRETPSYSAPQRETPSYSAPKRETPSYTPPPRSESSSQRSDGGKQQRNRERPEQRP